MNWVEIVARMPARQPFEPNATKAQLNKLWKMGLRGEEAMRALGRDQASWLIDAGRAAVEQGASNALSKLLMRAFAGIAVVGVGTLLLVLAGQALQGPKQATVAIRPSPAPTVTALPTSVPTPTAEEARAAQVNASQAAAVRKRPELGVAGSPLNRDFLAEAERLKRANDPLLNDPRHPEIIADRMANEIVRRAQSAPRR